MGEIQDFLDDNFKGWRLEPTEKDGQPAIKLVIVVPVKFLDDKDAVVKNLAKELIAVTKLILEV